MPLPSSLPPTPPLSLPPPLFNAAAAVAAAISTAYLGASFASSSSTPAVLDAAHAHTPGLREAHREATELPAMRRQLHALHCQHAYGENNTAADAASRRKWAV